MSFDPFRVDLDAVLDMSQRHSGLAAALAKSTETALSNAAGVDRVHGSIGSGATGAFSEVLNARRSALTAVSDTSSELSQRLSKAVSAYARGDDSGAESVRAAAAALEGGAALGSSGHGSVGAVESGAAADTLGRAPAAHQQMTHLVRDASESSGPEQPGGVGASIAAPPGSPVSPSHEAQVDN